MKAVRFHKNGPPDVLQYEDINEPECGPDDVILDVKASSVNHLDIWIRKGLPGMKMRLPRIPGCDAAGIIKFAGENVKNLPVGCRVLINPSISCGYCEFCSDGNASMCLTYSIFGEHQDGTYSQLVSAPAKNIIQIPDNMNFETAAAAPLVYLTAWRMIITRAKLKPSEDILILSAGAGVGTACLQIAKIAGARVIATSSSEEKCRKLSDIGADIVINHSREDFVKIIRDVTKKRGVDVVIDYIGKETWQKSIQSLRRGGRLVTCGATSGYDPLEDIRHIFYRQVDILGSTMGSNKELYDVLKIIFNGKIKPVVDRVLPLSDAKIAHELIEKRQVFGKLVLTP